MARDQLDRYPEQVADDSHGPALIKLVAKAQKAGPGERSSRGRVPAGAQPSRGGVGFLWSRLGRSGFPRQVRWRQLRQSCSAIANDCFHD